jgi:hypothetical protein
MTREDTVRALSTVLQHTTPQALDELRAERDRLARELISARGELRMVRGKYSQLRYNAWQIAIRALYAHEQPLGDALHQIVDETADSEDDRAYEEQWRE